ncbi:MAG: S1 RNA-binding domain-containing protein, partial [Candidatus Omnitrophica bacterium]|nr:S1 RNA-binding domain-containing protein [Candidatus Omnitrophota bacterium]
PGQTREGVVKNVTDFGVFVDLGGIDGLLHITDMSWGRVGHPSEMVNVGDKIEVVILDFDKENTKISLGLKQKTPNPWTVAAEKYPVGAKVQGKVVNIVSYGAFIELERGIEALVHVSELSWTKRVNHPSEVLKIGDMVEAVILAVDPENQKMALGIRQAQENPWLRVDQKYPPGTRIKGKVRNLTDYGAFIEVEEGIDGLVHISDMSWTRRINHPSEVLKKGQKVEAVVLSTDGASQKISLGIKQLTLDPWPDIIERYPAGTTVEGKVTKLAAFGVFIEMEAELEGLVHVSELEGTGPLENRFKPGDIVRVRVIRLDEEKRQIGLSMKGVK